MKIIQTSDLTPSRYTALWQEFDVRNGIDTMVTYEVLEALLPQLTPVTAATYAFSRSLQGPILEMNMRGLRVDEERRQQVLQEYRLGVVRLTDNLNRIIREGIGWQFEITKNRKYGWPSDDQLKTLFFDVLGIPEIRKRNTQGEMTRTVDHDALEKLEGYFYAETIVRHIISLRELGKKISFLSTSIDSDGRLRTSFNIAGTTTGRLASSFSDFGTGTNLQNVENLLRSIFVADPGYKFCNIDLEQSDARAVGAIHWNLFRDSRYLDACESGDLHTSTARSGFPALNWSGDRRADRQLADTKFYREFSYRDASKRLGHGTNYQGQPDKMARATHIPLANIVAFQRAYLAQFPAFPLWWEWVERQVRDARRIVSLTGRQRYFFGHPRDPETIRKAVAYEPQCVTADVIDRGLLDVWRGNFCQLLLQVHDSILFQFPADREDEIVPKALALVEQTFRLKDGRDFVIPAEAKVGWNWSDFRSDQPDPDALRKFNDTDRPRLRARKPQSVLDRLGACIS
jgi:DNA polymerase-1